MSSTLVHVTVDCRDAAALAGFWAAVFERPVDDGANAFFATIGYGAGLVPGGPALMFLQVPEERAGKNRLHLDLASTDWAAEADRLVALGAKRLDEHDEYGTHWLTLADPEGNLFDLAEVR